VHAAPLWRLTLQGAQPPATGRIHGPPHRAPQAAVRSEPARHDPAALPLARRLTCNAGTACRQSFWKAGTGYGHGKADGPVWDAKAAEAAQRAQDHQRQLVLRQLAAALALELGGSVGPLPASYGAAACPAPITELHVTYAARVSPSARRRIFNELTVTRAQRP
jgi:hypothetical protein